MSQPIAVAAHLRNAVTVLSVTPYEEDQLWLRNIVSHSKWKLYGADRWNLHWPPCTSTKWASSFLKGICRLTRGRICYAQYVAFKIHRK